MSISTSDTTSASTSGATGGATQTAPAAEAAVVAMPFAKALNAGLRAAMAADDHVLMMGEDIGKLGGVFRVTEGLQAEFGDRRVLDTPLAESGIVGTAIGLAMAGFRPVVEIQFDGFVFPAFDQITTQLAKMTNRLEGAASLPVVIRIPYGGHIGAIEHHQESPETYFAHTPGLRVVSPSTPNDAYWMIQDAIASNDPVIFLEPKAKYWMKGEVVDVRSLSPIDYAPILDSVRRTGRMVYAQEAPGNVSVGSEVAATVMERAFFALESPVIRVSGFDVPFPPAKLEGTYLPDADRILEAVDRALAY